MIDIDTPAKSQSSVIKTFFPSLKKMSVSLSVCQIKHEFHQFAVR